MKKIMTACALVLSTFAFSQVGIGTTTPHASADLELGSNNKALYLNRVANTAAVANPQQGMVIYDLESKCVKAYQSNPPAWSGCLSGGAGITVGTIASLACSSASFSPSTATQGTAYTGTLLIPYTGGNGGVYAGQTITSTGVTGLTATLQAGFFANGNGNLSFSVSGTPSGSGNASFPITIGGQTCSGATAISLSVTATVASLTCGSVAFSPTTVTQGTAYTGTLTVPYTGGTGGSYPAQNFTQNGLIYNLPAGNFATGSGSLLYSVTGTPTASGVNSVNITVGGHSCTNAGSLTVNPKTTVPTNTTGAGTLSGKTCFDVVQVNNGGSCGLLSSRQAQKSDFTLTATNTQVYTFTPSGNVSNIRFLYVDATGKVIQSITPNGTYTGNYTAASSPKPSATVVYYNNLNTVASGLSRENALLADIYVVYNNAASSAGTDVQLKLTARVQDCNCCGAFVAAGDWKEFMCHNLGADQSADPFTSSWRLNGSFTQWGRNNATGGGMSSTSNNGANGFAAAPSGPSYAQSNAGAIPGWSGTGTGTNDWERGLSNPCPAGYRVPSLAEWAGVVNNNTYWFSDNGTLFNVGPNTSTSTMSLPSNIGYRVASSGALINNGSITYYWSSDNVSSSGNSSSPGNVGATLTLAPGSNSLTANSSGPRIVDGASVRCIAQ